METTEDERFEILYVSRSRRGQEGKRRVRARSIARRTDASRPLFGDITHDLFHVIDNVGGSFWSTPIKTLPNGRIVGIDPDDPAEQNWKSVVAEKPEPLERASTAGGKLFVVYMEDVTARVSVHGLDGSIRS